MKILQSMVLLSSLTSINACATFGGTSAKPSKASDNIPTKTAAPAGDKSRQLDCIGENQTTKGNTRPDCLPNDADGAARDTEAGSGGSPLHP